MNRSSLILAVLLACTTAAAHDHHPGDDPPPVQTPVRVRSSDNWGGAAAHIAVSALAGGVCTAHITRSQEFAPNFGCAMVPGLVKELLDATDKGNRFSYRDIAADMLGAAVGVQIGRCVVYGRGFLCKAEW